MGLRLLVYLALAGLIYWGLRSIIKDWRKKFAADDAEDERKRQAQLKRNRQEARRPDVIELKRDDDGIYRPGQRTDERDKDRH